MDIDVIYNIANQEKNTKAMVSVTKTGDTLYEIDVWNSKINLVYDSVKNECYLDDHSEFQDLDDDEQRIIGDIIMHVEGRF